MRSLVLGACLMTVGPALGQPGPEKVFLEVPMLLEAPQHQKMIRAWHDGERFYVDAVMLLSELGFAVTSENATVTALDIDSKIVIDFARRQQVLPQQRSLHKEVLHSDGRFLLSMAALRRVFGSDIHFDTDRLHLRISTSAQLFDASSMHMRRPSLERSPGTADIQAAPCLVGRCHAELANPPPARIPPGGSAGHGQRIARHPSRTFGGQGVRR